jgi:RNA polymerase sigma-B factor
VSSARRPSRPGRTATTDEVAALFGALGRGEPGARAQLIERHLPLARALAARYRTSPQPLEDLEQVAAIGLVKAVDAYDAGRGVPFPAFAVPTILGELKRHMRDASWDLHVPRSLKERVLAIEAAERALAAQRSTPPTVAELAAAAGVSAEEVLEALRARFAHDAVALERGESDPGPAAEDFAAALTERLALSEAMAVLSPRERTIVELRFGAGLTQSEIAARVGVSQMYVSRLLRAALERLRTEIEKS